MRALGWPAALLALLAACGGSGSGTSDAAGTAPGVSATVRARAGAPPASAAGGSSAAAITTPGAGWVDPEPAEAQARAEEAVAAAWNADKTTRLAMDITTLERSTTGVEGFRTSLGPATTSLDERLSRLGAEVTGTEVTIRLPGSVLFDFDSAQVRPDAERTLDELAEVLKGYAGRPARIEGHTDSVASDDYNQKLSERRADAVRAWLVAHGTERTRLATRGFGETKPIADNATAEGRQRNRRVEVIIEKGR